MSMRYYCMFINFYGILVYKFDEVYISIKSTNLYLLFMFYEVTIIIINIYVFNFFSSKTVMLAKKNRN